jgi:energy-coupling factor transporter ATP-binding protein EcfA2
MVSNNMPTVTVRFRDDANRYDLWQVSSGVKDVMVLIAVVHFARPGSLIILEEPENHLHPAAQKGLMAVIEEAARSDGKQTLITTHSEVIVGQFSPEQIWFVDRKGARTRLQRLADAEIYEIWEQLGIERERFIEILGDTRQVLVILEGRDDYNALEPLWEAYGLNEVVLARSSGGGGHDEIAASARRLQDALSRFGFSATVFVVLDANGNREEKVAALAREGFDEATSHVWQEKEIESYLPIPETLALLAGRAADDVRPET